MDVFFPISQVACEYQLTTKQWASLASTVPALVHTVSKLITAASVCLFLLAFAGREAS